MLFDSPPSEFPGSGVEVILAPGHTDNSVSYRCRSPHGKTYLTGNGGDEAELADRLAILRDLEIGVVICSVSTGGMEIV